MQDLRGHPAEPLPALRQPPVPRVADKEMKISLPAFLRRCGLFAAILMMVSLGGAAPARAVTKGAVTPVLIVQASGKYNWDVTWGGTMTGWARGNLTIVAKFYVDGTLAGTRDNDCENSTYCEVANQRCAETAPNHPS